MLRLAPLLPGVKATQASDLIPFARAYAQRYREDVPHLELAAALLHTAHAQAWEQANPAATLALTDGLLPLIGRLSLLAHAGSILSRGIEASQDLGDERERSRFQIRLGSLRYILGDFRTGQRLWQEGVDMALACAAQTGPWAPFMGFAYMADIAGEIEEADRLIATWQAYAAADGLSARFVRGFFARRHCHSNLARKDLAHCLQTVAQCEPSASPTRQLFSFAVQTELARLCGDFPRSRALAETAIALARLHADWYTVIVLLMDHALFAYQVGSWEDARATATTIAAMTKEVAAPGPLSMVRCLGRKLAMGAPARVTIYDATPGSALGPVERLTQREQAVLRLVAEGCSNHEVAAQLVVTPATVKKHLEHIYAKLAAHNRTAAVARAQALALLP
jgi:DNA-binding CsgD family transcriptional regulator